MQRNATQRNAIQRNAIQLNTIQYNTIQYNTIQYNTIQYNTIQYITLHNFLVPEQGILLDFSTPEQGGKSKMPVAHTRRGGGGGYRPSTENETGQILHFMIKIVMKRRETALSSFSSGAVNDFKIVI